MITSRAIAIVTISGAVGIGLGGFTTFWYMSDFNAQTMATNLLLKTQADLISKELLLERLRGGNVSGATQVLEGLLDGDLVTAGTLIGQGYQFSPNAQQAMVSEANARKASGYQPSSPEVQVAVQKSLSHLSGIVP